MIEIDGISSSILLIRKDLAGKKFRVAENNESSEKYIDEATENLQGKNIVAIDPGKNSILYCVDSDKKDANTLDYRQTQRRKESKTKKYAAIIDSLKKTKINNQLVVEIETELSLFNRKTLQISGYLKYLSKKNEINRKLAQFYQQKIFRKLKLNGYINRKRHEQKLVNRFKNKFGNPKDTVVCIGDYEQRHHMKHKEPTKGIGMRTVLRKAGYSVYLVDEHKTSCRCSKCGGQNKKFMPRKNHNGNLVLVHALLRCQNGCGVWNRDCNGSSNIYKIVKNSIDKLARPVHLLRKQTKVKIKLTVQVKQLNGSLPSS